MRGVHRGVITLELVISLGLMATLCVAIMPSITAMVKSVRILSRRVEDSSTSLFIADFLTEKIRNTVEGVEKEARQGNTYDYREEMQDGTWQTYTLRQQGSRLEIRIPGGFSQPITGGAGDVETVTGVEGNPLFTVYTGGLVEIAVILGKPDGKYRQVLHTAVYPYAELIRGIYGKAKGRSKRTSSVPYDGSYRSGRRTAGYDGAVTYGGLLL